jgi:hypothetical protein
MVLAEHNREVDMVHIQEEGKVHIQEVDMVHIQEEGKVHNRVVDKVNNQLVDKVLEEFVEPEVVQHRQFGSMGMSYYQRQKLQVHLREEDRS